MNQFSHYSYQISSKQIEDTCHALTGHLFHEKVSRSIPKQPIDDIEHGIPGVDANKFTNPLAALSATFLEPVMSVINVYLLAVRSVFNIIHWTDPYLSFWFLVLLFVIMIFLAICPFRKIFLISGLVFFGPQVRKTFASNFEIM